MLPLGFSEKQIWVQQKQGRNVYHKSRLNKSTTVRAVFVFVSFSLCGMVSGLYGALYIYIFANIMFL